MIDEELELASCSANTQSFRTRINFKIYQAITFFENYEDSKFEAVFKDIAKR